PITDSCFPPRTSRYLGQRDCKSRTKDHAAPKSDVSVGSRAAFAQASAPPPLYPRLLPTCCSKILGGVGPRAATTSRRHERDQIRERGRRFDPFKSACYCRSSICVITSGKCRMEFDDVILGRRSIRGFKPDPVPPKLIKEILALAMRAPSSMNTQ